MKSLSILAATLLTAAGAMPAAANEKPQVIGWVEHVGIASGSLVMNAKVDTGADESSIYAKDVRVSRKDGIEMVRFTVRNKAGKYVTLERPLLRYALIKRRRNAVPLRRPVVEMTVCVGHELEKTAVNLADREHFKYRMLIGRNYLRKGYMMVDPTRQYTAEPACGAVASK